jgi:hypothetical protein
MANEAQTASARWERGRRSESMLRAWRGNRGAANDALGVGLTGVMAQGGLGRGVHHGGRNAWLGMAPTAG